MSPNGTWTTADVPDLSGHVAIISGSNTGIGYQAAAVLAESGAHVVLAVRNTEKGNHALARIVAASPERRCHVAGTRPRFVGIGAHGGRRAAQGLPAHRSADQQRRGDVDAQAAHRRRVRDAVRHQPSRPFRADRAVAGEPAAGPRLASGDGQQLGHRLRAAIDFDDLQSEQHYDRFAAYGQSKLANLLFTYELQRRLATAQKNTIAVAAHPGAASTELGRNAPTLLKPLFALAGPLLFQNAAMGALPTLRAATDPDVEGGQYYGPDGLGEQRGHPKLVSSSAQSHDEDVQRRLWAVSEELTGVTYPV